MKAFNASFMLSTEDRTEVSDITKFIREAIQQFPVANGIALINTMHTTCALFINEFQSALIDDL
ncbi:MAG: YjbQ family protein, partial [Dongiaceae bacterium]